MKLTNIASNMSEVEFGRHTVLFSYQTPVAALVMGELYQTENKFSQTTSKHISKWLAGREAKFKPQSFFNDLVKD